ncbi:MAG: class I SAM-dependent methyltransferase [Acidobacteriota bacterium]
MGSANIQGPLWSVAAQDWATYQESAFLPLWRDALQAVHAQEDMKILDAGCGAGGACVEADKIGCETIGIDASSALLEIARKRLPNVKFHEGDIESLPFDDSEFDAVIAVNSVLYAADITQTMKEMARVIRPQGRIVITNWGKPEDCEVRDILDAVVRILPFKPPKGPFWLSASGKLESLLEDVGFTVIESGETRCDFIYPSFEICWRAQRSAGPLQAAMKVLGEMRVYTAVEEVVKKYTDTSGAVVLRNRFIWVVGQLL